MSMIVNSVAFQIGWFATVIGGANNLAWAGTTAAFVIVAFHLYRVANPRIELLLIVLVGVLGAVWDSTMVALGITSYPSGTFIDGIAPHWIIALWLLFATTLNVSLRWLRGRFLVGFICGAIFGPLAFYGGHLLGGVNFTDLSFAMVVLSVGWAMMMPVLLILAEKLDGTSSTSLSVNHQQTV